MCKLSPTGQSGISDVRTGVKRTKKIDRGAVILNDIILRGNNETNEGQSRMQAQGGFIVCILDIHLLDILS